jgi:ferredoxin--NADP+ reductase
VIGVGNVMIDIAHWLIRDLKVDEVVAVARRGPAEVKFTRKEMEYVVANLELNAFDAEIERVADYMLEVGQDPQAAKDFILSALPRAEQPVSETRFRFEFLSSPSVILGDEAGRVSGLEIEDTKLIPKNGDTKAQRLGTKRILDVDTVIFCIGDKVDETFGLPIEWNEFVKNPEPRFPIGDASYEAFDPAVGKLLENTFVAGWSREASNGLVGVARKDGENGAAAVIQYLKTLQPLEDPQEVLTKLQVRLQQLHKPVVTKQDWQRLEEVEQAEAEKRDLEAYKFDSNDEMLAAIKKQTA